MVRSPVLDKKQRYTFSNDFGLTADPAEVFSELGATFKKKALQLLAASNELRFLPDLEKRLLQTLELVDLTPEAELMALDQWTTPLLYGAVTTGDAWKFGCLHRTDKTLVQDMRLYTVPLDLRSLVCILLSIIQDD